MAHGLETRVPFMDNDLVDFALTCPVKYKLRGLHREPRINENFFGDKKTQYFEKTNDGKQILRKMMSRYVPAEVVKSVKQGFSSPDSSWFKGESINFVRRELCNKSAPIYDILDFKYTNKKIDEHLCGDKNRRLLIWSLLYVNEYLKQKNY